MRRAITVFTAVLVGCFIAGASLHADPAANANKAVADARAKQAAVRAVYVKDSASKGDYARGSNNLQTAEMSLRMKRFADAERFAGFAGSEFDRIMKRHKIELSSAPAAKPVEKPAPVVKIDAAAKNKASAAIQEAKKLQAEKKALLAGVRNSDYFSGESSLKIAERWFAENKFVYASNDAEKAKASFSKIIARGVDSNQDKYKNEAAAAIAATEKLMKEKEKVHGKSDSFKLAVTNLNTAKMSFQQKTYSTVKTHTDRANAIFNSLKDPAPAAASNGPEKLAEDAIARADKLMEEKRAKYARNGTFKLGERNLRSAKTTLRMKNYEGAKKTAENAIGYFEKLK